MQPRHHQQGNLFEQDRETPDIPAAQRSTLIRLIEGLLVEALAGDARKTGAPSKKTKEGAHEQDHA